jgi:D-glycero-alpha-D-manno-heptose 1-phosphate guanylyltransferase
MTSIPALILAGGLGIRLRSVDQGLPKPMVPVCEKPFMYWLIKGLEKKGFSHFIFSTGYKSEIIENYNWGSPFPKCQFEFAKENSPFGTGGAVKNIFDLNPSLRAVWVINGDTILENALAPNGESSNLDVIYAALEPKCVFDAFPNLIIQDDKIVDVKVGKGSLFDGGQVYINRKAVDQSQLTKPFSFDQLIAGSFSNSKVGFKIVPGTCYDIGTPERLLRFENYLKKEIIPREK